jgi:hypothetical protein
MKTGLLLILNGKNAEFMRDSGGRQSDQPQRELVAQQDATYG